MYDKEKLIQDCINDPTPIEDRLCGKYGIGPDNCFGTRQFDLKDWPIIQLAASQVIKELRTEIKDLKQIVNNSLKILER